MKKKQLRAENGKLRAKVVANVQLEQRVKVTAAMNYTLKGANDRLKKAVMKLDGKNRRLRARLEQATEQITALADLNLMIRSELYANIHAADLRGAKAAIQVKEIEQIMPGGGKPALVYEDDQEKGRKQKRYGSAKG